MPKYVVEFKGTVFARTIVEADDEYEAGERAFADGFPELCAQCSGWGKNYQLEIPDEPACWEQDDVREAGETSAPREGTP